MVCQVDGPCPSCLSEPEVVVQAAASPLPGFLFARFRTARTALLAAFQDAIESSVLQGTIAEAVYRSSGVCLPCMRMSVPSSMGPASSRMKHAFVSTVACPPDVIASESLQSPLLCYGVCTCTRARVG